MKVSLLEKKNSVSEARCRQLEGKLEEERQRHEEERQRCDKELQEANQQVLQQQQECDRLTSKLCESDAKHQREVKHLTECLEKSIAEAQNVKEEGTLDATKTRQKEFKLAIELGRLKQKEKEIVAAGLKVKEQQEKLEDRIIEMKDQKEKNDSQSCQYKFMVEEVMRKDSEVQTSRAEKERQREVDKIQILEDELKQKQALLFKKDPSFKKDSQLQKARKPAKDKVKPRFLKKVDGHPRPVEAVEEELQPQETPLIVVPLTDTNSTDVRLSQEDGCSRADKPSMGPSAPEHAGVPEVDI
nr:PREDICTED: trichohyalin-like [Stegastes partitus]